MAEPGFEPGTFSVHNCIPAQPYTILHVQMGPWFPKRGDLSTTVGHIDSLLRPKSPFPLPQPRTPSKHQWFRQHDQPQRVTPVIHRYQALRALLAATVIVPASYQPFLGVTNLAPSALNLNTTHANQQCMSSASAVLPRHSNLVRRTACGPARHAPSLARRPQIDQCFVKGASVPTVRIQVLVYPPHNPDATDNTYYVYRLLSTDFQDHQLEANDLAYRYELPLTTPVNELLEMVITSMRISASAYTLQTARRTSASAAITSIQPPALISKGRVHHDQVRLRVLAEITIGNMAADRNRFAGDVCFADERFIIRLDMFSPTVDNYISPISQLLWFTARSAGSLSARGGACYLPSTEILQLIA
ncbi:hypothetical protein C8F04DRAFT_1172426 [Mycena alexandri]|uniref:Uncharacterized protein n=1 Tax=Mycena alexandri TaxID=1745969 RepID=A0AAD6TN79_9AGAR|nr:hypothetical protein C8F04DRAFT_1172426 [Mycena alexandri]